MSEDEIQQLFPLESRRLETIAKWRANRAELAAQGKGSLPLVGEVGMLFHVIPSDSLARRTIREPLHVPQQQWSQIYVTSQATNFRYNQDGFLASARVGNELSAYGYTQIFRSGIFEYANGNCYMSPRNGMGPMVLGQELEQMMVRSYENATDRLRALGQDEPVYIGFSLLGIAGKSFFATVTRSAFSTVTVDPTLEIFNSPEVLADVTSPEESPFGGILRPLVDTMWQVAGEGQTPFITNGVWDPFRRYLM
jgi:hypothetical protein